MAAIVSRWARRYVGVAVAALLAWQVGLLVGVPRGTEVALGLYGFVLHVVFGKAYSLVPSYFDRELGHPRAAVVQLPLTAFGVACLALAPLRGTPHVLDSLGAVLWTAGIVVFVGAIAWTVRDNLGGGETGTGGPNAHRQRVDRAANAVVPVALAYLLVGSYATLGVAGLVPPVFDGYPPRVTHLLGTGTATLLVFGLGARLLPRFLVADPPEQLVFVVLPAGAVGPILLAATLPAGRWFHLAAAVEAVAVVGYAAIVATLFVRSEHRRTALYGVLLGAVGGVAAVSLGAWFAFVGLDGALVDAHRRLTLLGFLGLTIVGVSLQFYPPNVGRWPGCDDRTALAAMGLLAVGVAVQATGIVLETEPVESVGVGLALVGGFAYAYLLAGAFATR